MAENQQAPQQNVKNKRWRAKIDCTFQGRRIKKGEIVFAAEMKNTHFEAVKGETDK